VDRLDNQRSSLSFGALYARASSRKLVQPEREPGSQRLAVLIRLELYSIVIGRPSRGRSFCDTNSMHSNEQAAATLPRGKQANGRAPVLLKNERQLLPLDPRTIKGIAVVGPNADAVNLGGYSDRPGRGVSALAGMKAYLGTQAEVRHAPGCRLAQPGYDWWSGQSRLDNFTKDDPLIEQASHRLPQPRGSDCHPRNRRQRSRNPRRILLRPGRRRCRRRSSLRRPKLLRQAADQLPPLNRPDPLSSQPETNRPPWLPLYQHRATMLIRPRLELFPIRVFSASAKPRPSTHIKGHPDPPERRCHQHRRTVWLRNHATLPA